MLEKIIHMEGADRGKAGYDVQTLPQPEDSIRFGPDFVDSIIRVLFCRATSNLIGKRRLE